jgi:large subunit ribosomal protein L4
MKLNVIDKKGKAVAEIAVDESVFGAERNEILIHEVAVALQNNQRQGSFSNLTMAEVRGHHKKPYRQKGTGNARQGTTKGPQFTGGGIVFAKKPRDFSTKINQRKKMAAFVSAISGKIADGELLVIKDLELTEYKTKSVAALLENLRLSGKTVAFVNGYKPEFVRSVRNIAKATATTPEQLSVLDIVTNKVLVVSADAIKSIERQYREQGEQPAVKAAPLKKETAATKTAATTKPTTAIKKTAAAIAALTAKATSTPKKPTATKAITTAKPTAAAKKEQPAVIAAAVKPSAVAKPTAPAAKKPAVNPAAKKEAVK